jgi:acyl-CoA synthetase (AMP-forming)/AMP-acid ligase II
VLHLAPGARLDEYGGPLRMTTRHVTEIPPNASIASLIDAHAAAEPEKTFLVVPAGEDAPAREISYRELREAVRAFSARLDGLGIAPGEPVSVMMSNGWCAVLSILGALYGGRIVAPVNLVAGDTQIGYMLDHSGTRIVLASDEEEVRLRAITGRLDGDIRIVTCPADDPPRWPEDCGGDSEAVTGESDCEADGLLMYTSGTTGNPKGAVLSQRAIIAGGANAITAHHLTGADKTLLVLPLYHINGFCVSLMSTIRSGASLVVPHRFSARRFWDQLLDNECTWFSAVPTQIQYLLKGAEENGPPPRERMEGVRFARSASAPLSPDIQRRFEDLTGLIIIETMGLTECAAQILSNPMPPGVRKFGSPGIAFGNEVRVVDDGFKPVPAGTPGEIAVRGDNVFRLYLKNEAATTEAFTPDGWFRTGDLGYMDEDGYVFVTGRIKELIIKGGENIAPREIDEALLSHPDVVEAAAFARSCENYGQTVEAAVVLSAAGGCGEAELIELCRSHVGAFKAPDRVHILTDLPRGPSGKVQRLKLAEQFS